MDYSVSVSYTGDRFSDIYDPMHLAYLQLSPTDTVRIGIRESELRLSISDERNPGRVRFLSENHEWRLRISQLRIFRIRHLPEASRGS